jgi:hypothetical protein
LLALLPLAACGRLGFGSEDPDLMAYLSLDDDPTTGRFVDHSGHGNDARCVVGVTCPTTAPGKVGNAVRFDGMQQYLLITSSPEIDVAGPFTIAAWVYIDDATFDQVAIGHELGTGTTDSFAFVSWHGSSTCMETAIAGEVHQDVCSPFIMPATEWHHLAGTFDGTFKSLWIDGLPVAAQPGTPTAYDGHDTLVGSDLNGGQPAYMWHGRVDEVRIYSRALSELEIGQLAMR